MRLADLALVNCFFQVNLVRGFRYLDDAGKIMNRWDEEFSEKAVGLNGLVMRNPAAQSLVQVQVDTSKIWAHFRKPPTLTYVFDHAANLADEISAILGVETYRRTALRVQYVAPVGNVDSASRRLGADVAPYLIEMVASQQREVEGLEMAIRVADPLLSSRVAIGVTSRELVPDSANDLPERAILFDADLFSTETIEARRAKLVLLRIPGWLKEHLEPLVAKYTEGLE